MPTATSVPVVDVNIDGASFYYAEVFEETDMTDSLAEQARIITSLATVLLRLSVSFASVPLVLFGLATAFPSAASSFLALLGLDR